MTVGKEWMNNPSSQQNIYSRLGNFFIVLCTFIDCLCKAIDCLMNDFPKRGNFSLLMNEREKLFSQATTWFEKRKLCKLLRNYTSVVNSRWPKTISCHSTFQLHSFANEFVSFRLIENVVKRPFETTPNELRMDFVTASGKKFCFERKNSHSTIISLRSLLVSNKFVWQKSENSKKKTHWACH